MTQNELYDLAVQADCVNTPLIELRRFAALVAAKTALIEREACAEIARNTATPDATRYGDGYNQCALDLEAVIRARSNDAKG